MPLEIISNSNYENNVNKNNRFKYVNKLVAEVKSYVKTPEDRKNIKELLSFTFYVLAPAYEEYIIYKFKKEKWEDLLKDPIEPSEKDIFPNGIKSWLEYFNEFIKAIKSWEIKIQVNAWEYDFDNDLKMFENLDPKIKGKLFKILYYGTYRFDPLERQLRVSLIQTKKELNKLRKKVKK